MSRLFKTGKFGVLAFCVSISLFLLCFKASQSAKSGGTQTDLASTKAYCDELELYVTGNLSRPTFLQDAPGKPWRQRKLPTDEKKRPYSEANVWFREGVPVVAYIFSDLHNTQWIRGLKLYFRSDGTLAKSQFAAIGQKNNHTSVFRIEYFNKQGKLIFARTKAVDKRTQKEKPLQKLPFKIPQYRKITELPFSSLLADSAK